MEPEVLDLYDRLLHEAVEAVGGDQSEADYCRQIHKVWRAALERHDVPPDKYRLVMQQTRHVAKNVRAGLSRSSLIEWLDAYPSSIMGLIDEQIV